MTCPNCKHESPEDAIQCAECGYPFSGSPETKAKFIAGQVIKSSEIVDSKAYIRNAGFVLYAVGTIMIASAVFTSIDAIEMGIDITIGIIFILFGIFMKHSPVLFVSVPFALLLIIFIWNYIDDPMALSFDLRSRIIVLKAIMIAGLTHGLRSAILADRYRKESSYLSKQ